MLMFLRMGVLTFAAATFSGAAQAGVLDLTNDVTAKVTTGKVASNVKAQADVTAKANVAGINADICVSAAVNEDPNGCTLANSVTSEAVNLNVLADLTGMMPPTWLKGLPVFTTESVLVGKVVGFKTGPGNALLSIVVASDDHGTVEITQGIGSIDKNRILLEMKAGEMGIASVGRSTMGMPNVSRVPSMGSVREMPVYGSDNEQVGWVSSVGLMGGMLIESIDFRTNEDRTVRLVNGVAEINSTGVYLLIPSEQILTRAKRRYTELVLK